ncbi:MAG: hypothetical protein KatS3mg103_0687 [Phycisphaerales bacterium]|nr:MAG: hypothetical protein KatS3mg103_0687 [Phycisphaerales bacterium]
MDLVLHEGARTGRLDQAQWLALRLDRGAQADAYLAESVQTVRDRTRTPAGWAPWLGNTLVVVAPRGVGVPASALGDRTTPVHLALERTALGRWTRAALRQAGLWDEVAPTAGLFDNGRAIVQRLHESAQRDPPRPALGIVLGSDADPARVEIVGRLAPPADDPPVHAVAWLTQAGEDLASWLRHDPSARRTALAMGFLLPGPTLPDADGSAPTTPQPRAHPRGQPVLPPAGPALPAGGQR